MTKQYMLHYSIGCLPQVKRKTLTDSLVPVPEQLPTAPLFFVAFNLWWACFNASIRSRNLSLCKEPPDSVPQRPSPELGQRRRNAQKENWSNRSLGELRSPSPWRPLFFQSAMKGPGSKLEKASFISWEENDYRTVAFRGSSSWFKWFSFLMNLLKKKSLLKVSHEC